MICKGLSNKNKWVALLLLCIPGYAFAQSAEVIKYAKLQSLLSSSSENIQVINFWATWCGPCVKELPLFEEIHLLNKNLNVTLINLDFADEIKKVNAFLSRKHITAPVLLLDEIDYNSWIDKVDSSWSGAIPATLIFNPKTGERKFVERELNKVELEALIESLQ